MPASMSERINIASGMVEKSDDDIEVKRILAEADVFVKYGLVDRAAEHLRRVFERVPTHQGAHERLAAVLEQLDRKAEAAAEYEILAQQELESKPRNAAAFARKALLLNPSAHRAQEVLREVEGAKLPSSQGDITDSGELPEKTPEPDRVDSDEIELLVENTSSGEFDAQNGAAPAFEAPEATTGSGASVGGEYDDYELGNEGGTQIGAPVFPDEAEKQEAQPARTREPSPAEADDPFLAELEQVDFFIEQGLLDEASSMLDELEARSPGHILIADRREKLAGFGPDATTSQGAMPAQVHGSAPARDAGGAGGTSPDLSKTTREKHDAATFIDLGIMEKTMERYEAAMAHFKAAMTDPSKEVFAMSMIGECWEGLGNSAQAIRCYQDALKRPAATSAEATQIYFQLGNVFYNLGDHSEALYYFERVAKRDPNFRDIARRLAEVKSQAAVR
jgi:tetratricopeptide (TPR) repeat protein